MFQQLNRSTLLFPSLSMGWRRSGGPAAVCGPPAATHLQCGRHGTEPLWADRGRHCHWGTAPQGPYQSCCHGPLVSWGSPHQLGVAQSTGLPDIKASVNWMYAAKMGSEGVAMYEAATALKEAMVELQVLR